MPEFRSLAEILGNEGATNATERSDPLPVCTIDDDVLPAPDPPEGERLREVRLFGAHLAEALDRAVGSMLAGIARDVLARELLLAPADVHALVSATLQRYLQAGPLRVRVHRDDVASLANCAVPVFSDDALERGDALIDLSNGTIDLTLAARLQDVVPARPGT